MAYRIVDEVTRGKRVLYLIEHTHSKNFSDRNQWYFKSQVEGLNTLLAVHKQVKAWHWQSMGTEGKWSDMTRIGNMLDVYWKTYIHAVAADAVGRSKDMKYSKAYEKPTIANNGLIYKIDFNLGNPTCTIVSEHIEVHPKEPMVRTLLLRRVPIPPSATAASAAADK
jgi:hypothetical protein